MSESAADRADMEALQAGDLTALDRLMARWQRPLLAHLVRHGVREADAHDLAQECFVRVFRHRDRFDSRRRFTTWMFQIALNLRRDQGRREARRPTVPLNERPEPVDDHSPRFAAESTEVAEAVRAAIIRLPDHLREVVILAEYEHLSHAEIAQVVGTTTKAVESRLHRARGQLRQDLARWLKT